MKSDEIIHSTLEFYILLSTYSEALSMLFP
jgi:hypothetical protein